MRRARPRTRARPPPQRLCARASQKQAPTFGAVPSADDLRKKAAAAEEWAERKEDVLARKLQPGALTRLNKFEMDNPTKADLVKEKLLSGLSKNGEISDAFVKQLIEGILAEPAAAASRGVNLNRGRFDDSDSDIDLSDL